MLKLHFKDSRQAPLWLTEECFTIGQDGRNQLVMDDAGVSAFHAEIRQEQGHYYLSDCGSQTGTFVNDERIGSRYQLRSGDVLRLGAVEMELSDPAKSSVRQDGLSARWFLQVIKGEHQGHKYPISSSQTFGRSAQCELCFASDQELSRRHCEFYLQDDVLYFKDLGSANGVFVNQEKLAAGPLRPGDEVRMGSVGLLVIGPKVEIEQPEADEDATVFMQAVKVPKPAAKPQVSQAAALNPARAQAAAPQASAQAPASGNGRLLLLAGSVVLAVIVAAVVLLA